MKIAVSACLLGRNCKYNGGNNRSQAVLDFLKAGNKNTLDIVMLNAGDANESFELFFDNFRGVKAAAHTYYTGSGTPFGIGHTF